MLDDIFEKIIDICSNQEEVREVYYLKNDNGRILNKSIRIDVINLVKGKEMCYNENVSEYLINLCKVLTERNKEKLEEYTENILSKESKEKLLEEMKMLSGDEIMFKRFRRKSFYFRWFKIFNSFNWYRINIKHCRLYCRGNCKYFCKIYTF